MAPRCPGRVRGNNASSRAAAAPAARRGLTRCLACLHPQEAAWWRDQLAELLVEYPALAEVEQPPASQRTADDNDEVPGPGLLEQQLLAQVEQELLGQQQGPGAEAEVGPVELVGGAEPAGAPAAAEEAEWWPSATSSETVTCGVRVSARR